MIQRCERLILCDRWWMRRRRFKKERHRDLQSARDLLQTARADAVHAFLVPLDLLKADSDAVGKVRLTDVQQQPSHADAVTDMLVDLSDRFGVRALHRMPSKSHAKLAKPETTTTREPRPQGLAGPQRRISESKARSAAYS